jgi:hypothetical protein
MRRSRMGYLLYNKLEWCLQNTGHINPTQIQKTTHKKPLKNTIREDNKAQKLLPLRRSTHEESKISKISKINKKTKKQKTKEQKKTKEKKKIN